MKERRKGGKQRKFVLIVKISNLFCFLFGPKGHLSHLVARPPQDLTHERLEGGATAPPWKL